MQTIIGITGGTGCGKTTALHALRALGFHIIDCDALYHDMLQKDAQMLTAIECAFPGTVVNGILDRKRLGQQVFSDSHALDTLNETVWPFILRAVKAQIQGHAPQNCAIDAIGLFESGLSDLCTMTVAVTASDAARISRLILRDHITEDYAILRVQAQKENEVFSDRCDMTLCNDFTSEEQFFTHVINTFQTILKETAI